MGDLWMPNSNKIIAMNDSRWIYHSQLVTSTQSCNIVDEVQSTQPATLTDECTATNLDNVKIERKDIDAVSYLLNFIYSFIYFLRNFLFFVYAQILDRSTKNIFSKVIVSIKNYGFFISIYGFIPREKKNGSRWER